MKKRPIDPVACGFAAIGVTLAYAGWQFPRLGGVVPGPGFFPMVCGLAMLAFALPLFIAGRPRPVQWVATQQQARPLIALILALTLYLLLWHWVPFLIRTALLAIVLLRLASVGWRRATFAGCLTTLALWAGFFLGLHVNFD